MQFQKYILSRGNFNTHKHVCLCLRLCVFVLLLGSLCVCVGLYAFFVGGTLTKPPLKAHSYCGRRSSEIICDVEFSTQHKQEEEVEEQREEGFILYINNVCMHEYE